MHLSNSFVSTGSITKVIPSSGPLSTRHITNGSLTLDPRSNGPLTTGPVVNNPPHFEIEEYDNPLHKARGSHHLRDLTILSYFSPLVAIFNFLYLRFRIRCNLGGQHGSSGVDLALAWAFLVLEIVLSVQDTIYCSLTALTIGKMKTRKPLRLTGKNAPRMDVFVTSCGESLIVILDTVRAACALDYPKDRYRIVILDDGRSAELKSQIEVLQKTTTNLFYTARGINVETHSKAANINHGLGYVKTLPGGASEFMAVLDVDMIPVPHWLRAMVPHLLRDPMVAMATPPQRFYNIPDGDPLGQLISDVWDVGDPFQDVRGDMWCTGTGWVARQSAMDKLGGLPTQSMFEDVFTSMCLNSEGWKTVYVHENVQWGLAGESLTAHIRQVKRFCQSGASMPVVVWKYGPKTKRAKALIGSVVVFSRMVITVSALTLLMAFIPGVLLTGKPFVIYGSSQELMSLTRMSILQCLMTWVYSFLFARAADSRIPIWPPRQYSFIAPFQFMTLVRMVVSVTQKFAPTGRTSPSEMERAALDSGSVFRRLKVVLWDCGASFHLSILVTCFLGVVLSIIRMAARAESDSQDHWEQILVRFAWPPAFMLLTAIIGQCWTPIAYAIFPPKVFQQDREALLRRDTYTKVAYPSIKAINEARWRPSKAFSIFALACSLSLCGPVTFLVMQGSENLRYSIRA